MGKFKLRKPRFNLIIRKKHLIVASLTLILGIAVYANYLVVSRNNLVESLDADKNGSEVNYGDAAFVSGSSDKKSDIKLSGSTTDEVDAYFVSARLDKKEKRDEAKELLAAVFNGGDVLGSEIEVLAQDTETLSNYIECEATVESLLKAQGFDDVLCYLSEKGANIIVRSDGLNAEEVAIIKNALLSEVDFPAEKITILEIN